MSNKRMTYLIDLQVIYILLERFSCAPLAIDILLNRPRLFIIPLLIQSYISALHHLTLYL